MQLSKRLSAVAEFVTPGGCLVDVGTDHGYVPIALLEQKKISSAIFILERKPIRLPTLLGNCYSNAWTTICRTFVAGSGSMLPCPS